MDIASGLIVLCAPMSQTELVSLHFYRNHKARLAQSVDRKALNLVVVGSSPTVGVVIFFCFGEMYQLLSPIFIFVLFCGNILASVTVLFSPDFFRLARKHSKCAVD